MSAVSNVTWVCVPCRSTARARGGRHVCPGCGADMVARPYRWRAPRRDNLRAWARIARGDWWWDDRVNERFPARWLPMGAKLKRGKKILGYRIPS